MMLHLRSTARVACRLSSKSSCSASSSASASSRFASTLSAVLQESASEFPYRETFRDANAEVKWSNGEILEQATALANGFGELTLEPGDSIVTILPPNAENFVTNLAAASIGVEVVPVNLDEKGSLSANDLQSVLSKSSAKGLIFDPSANELVDELLPKVTEQSLLVEDREPLQDDRFPSLKFVTTTAYHLTDNNVLNFRQIFMHNAETRCSVKKAAKVIGEATPVVAGLTNKDVLAAADRAIAKLNIDSESQLTLSATSPQSIAVAGAIALQSNALLHLSGAEDLSGTTDIQDASLA